ncbi:hypothetical protein V8F20_010249 [Naviculisporaceae sp. PSN 640]
MPSKTDGDFAALPSGLTGRYGLYKRGTKKVLTWLVDTASQICDVSSVVQAMAVGQREIKPVDGEATTVTVTTQEMIKLARIVAAPSPTCQVPSEVLYILEDVIRARNHYAKWHEKMGGNNPHTVKQNSTHRYFILVLQKVHEVLSGLMISPDRVPPDEKTPGNINAGSLPKTRPDTNSETLSNLFDRLELEEPSSLSHGNDPADKPTADTRPRKTDIRIKKQHKDRAFAIFCFLQDLYDVKEFVHQTWRDFCNREVSFRVASQVTNTAFSLMDCADHEFSAVHGSTSYYDILKSLDLRLGLGHDPADVKYPFCEGEVECIKKLCPSGARAISFFGMCMAYHDHQWHKHSTGSERQEQENSATDIKAPDPEDSDLLISREFAQALRRASLLAFRHLRSPRCGYLNVDGFLRELCRCMVTPFYGGRMSLVYAAEIYQNLYDLVGYENLGVGLNAFKELHTHLNNLAADTDVLRFLPAQDLKDEVGLLGTDNCLDDDSEAFEEGSEEYWVRTADQQKAWQVLGCTASPLEQKLPIIPGVHLQVLYLTYHEIGCGYANSKFAVLGMAYLYRLVTSLGLFEEEWQDMDFVIAKQHIPGAPLVPKGRHGHQAGKLKRAFLKGLGSDKWNSENGELDLSISHLEKLNTRQILHTSCFDLKLDQEEEDNEKTWSRSKTRERVLHAITNNKCETSDNGKQRRGKYKYEDRKRYTPLELLSTFKKCTISDEPHLNFDYFRFTTDCVRLTETISRSTTCNNPKFCEQKVPPFSVVLSILKICEEEAGAPGWLGEDVATVLRDYIREHGPDKYKKQANEKSSGHIPKHLRPSFGPEAIRRYDSGEVGKIREFFPGGKRAGELRLYRVVSDEFPKAE